MNKLKQLFDKLNCKSSCCTGSISIDIDADDKPDILVTIKDGNVSILSPNESEPRTLKLLKRLRVKDN